MKQLNESKVDDYIKTEKIGEGTYGTVFKSKCKRTGATVALKKVKFHEENAGLPNTSIREISILREMKHPNIVQLVDIIIEANDLYLIFEFVTMDLQRYIIEYPGGLYPQLTQSYCYQLLQGLVYCHQRRIMHRDLKPANLLINKEGVIKIADFGFARAFSVPVGRVTQPVQTLWYRAPEILLGLVKYSCPIDVWSVGTILAEMINGRPLFRGDSEISQLSCIFQVMGTPTDTSWPSVSSLSNFPSAATLPIFDKNILDQRIGDQCSREALDLLQQLLTLNPCQRISAKESLLHPYFSDLDKESLPAKPGQFEVPDIETVE